MNESRRSHALYPPTHLMKRFLLLLLLCLTTWGAVAQNTAVSVLTDSETEMLARRVFVPIAGFYLLCNFVVTVIKLILNHLLKRQAIAAGVSESIVERLLPTTQDERNKVVKWVVLLLSTGAGLTLCNWYLPIGLHSVIIMIFSTAFGFLAYYLFLQRQTR